MGFENILLYIVIILMFIMVIGVVFLASSSIYHQWMDTPATVAAWCSGLCGDIGLDYYSSRGGWNEVYKCVCQHGGQVVIVFPR